MRGVVRAVHQAALSTELVTPVGAIGAREGQRFRAGDRLIEFDCRRQTHELSALAATVREAQVTHDSNAHLVRNGASNRNDVVIALARLEKAQAEHAALKQRLAGCLISAPFDGVVVELGVNAHELPPANKPLMMIASDRQLEIEVIVPSRELPRLSAGTVFEFTVDETQRVYLAQVLRAGGTVDPMSQTTKVFATFSETFDGVSPGMSGTAKLKISERPLMVTAQASTVGQSVRPISNGEGTTGADQAALALLLRIEQQARKAATLNELQQLAANETRKLNRARQIFVVDMATRRQPRVVAASGVGAVDASSMLVVAVGSLVQRLRNERELSQSVDFALPAYSEPDGDLAMAYPFRNLLWVPLAARDGGVFAGLVCCRETVWGQADIAVSNRLSETYAHAWRELTGRRTGKLRRLRPRFAALTIGLLAMGGLALPVPMTALAPAEVVAAEPMIVAAPVDGVIETIDVDPGQEVKPGDVLVRLSDTVLRNKAEIARRDVAVAEARIKQATILAMSDARGRHELGIAEADLELKRAELAFAVDMLTRSVIKAVRPGVAAYSDRKSLIGRPVATGERIMEIADPAAVEVRIDVAMPDAVALAPAGRVKLFLDVEPLSPREARIVRSDYKARPGDSEILAFKTFARFEGTEKAPRIGLRGTAQIYGEQTYLGVFLFRRPLVSVRQYLGL